MRFLLPVALAASLLAPAAAPAQVIDLSTIKCKEFLESGENTIGLIMMWLDGYFTDEDDPPVVDFNRMKVKAGQLGEYCAKNPTHGLITAAEPILEK